GTESGAFNESTAFAVIAHNAGLAQGAAGGVTSTTGPDAWDAICCSQFADVPRWTWSQNNGRPTDNVWPLSSSVAITRMTETFIGASNIHLGPSTQRYPRWDSSRALLTMYLGT